MSLAVEKVVSRLPMTSPRCGAPPEVPMGSSVKRTVKRVGTTDCAGILFCRGTERYA